MEFSSSSPFAQNIKTNDVLVSDKTPKAEFGFLRKITSVSNSNGKIVVTTQYASLSDVFEEANISFEQTFTQTDLKNGRVSANQAVPINIDVNYIVEDLDKDYKTENDQLAIKGSVKFEPTFKFNWKRDKGLLPEQVEMQLKIKDYSELKLNLGLGFTGKIPIVPPKILGSSTIIVPTPIGPVPIIFTHVISYNCKFEVGTSFETGAKIVSSGEYALGIKDNFEPFGDIRPKFSFTKPDYPERSAEIKVGVINPVYEARPYGVDVMKLYLEADAGIKLNVNLDKSPNWTVKLYALGKVGFKPNLSFFLKSISSDINYTTPDLFANGEPFDQGDFKIKVNPIPTNGLVAYYPFNGNANDESGNKNNGVVNQGVALSTDRKSNKDKAYSFGGVDKIGYIKVANSASMVLNKTLSISMWYKLNSYYGVDGYANPNQNGYHVMIGKEGYRDGFYMGVGNDATAKKQNVNFNNNIGFNSNFSLVGNPTGTNSENLNKWIHAVAVIDGINAKLYINGTLVKTMTIAPNFSSSNSKNLYIGTMWALSTTWYPFNGSIDDIRIYNRSLSNAEILALSKE